MVMLVAVDQRWLDGGQWLWSPVSTTIFSSSSPCRGVSLWFPSLFASVSSFFVGSRYIYIYILERLGRMHENKTFFLKT